MSISGKNRIFTLIKLLLSHFIVLASINIIIISFKRLYHIAFFRDYEIYSFTSLIAISFLLSLMKLSDYLYIKKAIRIDDRLGDIQKVKDTMQRMNWKIESEHDDAIVFKSVFSFGIWIDRIRVNFTDTEIHILGSKEYVKRLVSLANFTYEAYDICNLN
ncbi:MAG: hypothetical protein ACM3TR_03800 [Caulobacteraceae bacterium]